MYDPFLVYTIPGHKPKRLFPAIATHDNPCFYLLYSQQLGHENDTDTHEWMNDYEMWYYTQQNFIQP